MAAYAAVISVKHTIRHYLLNSDSDISLVSRDIIEFADEELTSVQQVLKRLDGNRSCSRSALQALDGQIRDAVSKLEDVIDSHIVSNLIHSQKGILISFEQEIASSIEEVRKTKELYIQELDNPSPQEEEEEDAVSSSVDFDGKKLNIFGLSGNDLIRIKKKLRKGMPYEFGVVSLVGVEGTGRSIMAKAAFKHSFHVFYDVRAWVSVGPNYEVKEIIISLLSQIDEGGVWDGDDDEKLGEQLCAMLKGRKYLIVLDNVCDTLLWDYLTTSFPLENTGSRVLLTTSLDQVARFAYSFETCQMDVLDEEDSWYCICKEIFGNQPCPLQLEEAGRKIAQNCRGLLVEVIKAVLLLSKAAETPEQWNKIAADQKLNFDAYDEMWQISQITNTPRLKRERWWRKSRRREDVCPQSGEWPNLFCSYGDDVTKRVLSIPYDIDGISKVLFKDNIRQQFEIVSLFGMAGIGKTTLAKKVIEDPSIIRRFDHRVWVTLGPKYRYERILMDILAQIDPNIDKKPVGGDEISAKHFRTILSSKKCLFLLDDVWDKEPLDYLGNLFKDIKFEVLLTTRLQEIANYSGAEVHNIRLLNTEESWRLFCDKVFGDKPCPVELEKPGRMIAENCEGLPLMIVAVASLLSQAKKSPEFWNKVARKENLVFQHAHDKIFSVLLPSYEFLPQHLKPHFLYMGVFPEKNENYSSKLIELWNSEGILESEFSKYLKELVSRSLLFTRKRSYNLELKTCRVHSVFWHMCVRKAREIKFFHVLNRRVDGLTRDIHGQCRLCIHNNILFCIKEVYTSMASNSSVRSLLCNGPHHQYQVSVCFSFVLLKILDALTIRFYEFPDGVFELLLLRYLALICNGKLPSSISRFQNLQYLIVGGHMSTKLSYEAPVYLPKEIWGMEQLKHLQVMGGDLPDPCGAVLQNLLILLDVSPHSCTESVLRGTPNLQKLGIRIELAPNGSGSLFNFEHISHLHELKSLKCVVVNPEFRCEAVPQPAPALMFPSGLRKLSLSGLGYPWEYMNTIGKLENLEVLKLRCYAFRGPEWLILVLGIC